MRLDRSPRATALLLVATTALLTGCSAADLAMTRRACAANPTACRLVQRELNDELNGATSPTRVERLSRDAVPAVLSKWADSDAARRAGGSAYSEGGYTYLAISGGEQPTGGYQVDFPRIIQVQGGYRVEASVVPPEGPAIDAVTVVLGFFRAPTLDGAISFAVSGGVSVGGQPDPVQSLTLQAASSAQAPEALQSWIASQRSSPKPEGKVLTAGSETWIALSGGLRPTGGYRVEVERTFQENGTWIIAARVVPPAPGAMVTQALTTPTAYYKTSALTGPIEIRWNDLPGPSPSIKQ